MTIPTFSLTISRHLSSLAPKFEGHWTYVVITNIYSRIGHDTKKFKQPDEVHLLCKRELEYFSSVGGEAKAEFIPAWQVEDVLRNLKAIGEKLNWGWVCGDCGHERPRKAEPGDVRCDCDDPWYSWPQKYSNRAGEILAGYLHDHPDTYYQKIEEYLWKVLK